MGSEMCIRDRVKEVIQEVGAESMQDIGEVMGCLKSSLAGSAAVSYTHLTLPTKA